MTNKGYQNKLTLGLSLVAGLVWSGMPALASPGAEDIQFTPFGTVSAPVHLSGAPIGIESQYSYGAPIGNSKFAQQDQMAEGSKFIRIPAGTQLDVTLLEGLTNEVARTSQTIRTRLKNEVALADGAKIPANTLVIGHCSQVPETSANFGGFGTTQITFDQMQLSNGTIIPISTNIVGGLNQDQLNAMRMDVQPHTFARVIPNVNDTQSINSLVFRPKNQLTMLMGQTFRLNLQQDAQVASDAGNKL